MPLLSCQPEHPCTRPFLVLPVASDRTLATEMRDKCWLNICAVQERVIPGEVMWRYMRNRPRGREEGERNGWKTGGRAWHDKYVHITFHTLQSCPEFSSATASS